MQSIGLSVEEIAIVYLALPLTTFLAPPVSGTYLFIFQVFFFLYIYEYEYIDIL